jgi:hypothetical protein
LECGARSYLRVKVVGIFARGDGDIYGEERHRRGWKKLEENVRI